MTILAHYLRNSPDLNDGNWRKFKSSFGEFLLNSKLIEEPALNELAEIKQSERSSKIAILSMIDQLPKDAIAFKKYKEFVISYSDLGEDLPQSSLGPYGILEAIFDHIPSSEIRELAKHSPPLLSSIFNAFAAKGERNEAWAFERVKNFIGDLEDANHPMERIRREVESSDLYQAFRRFIADPSALPATSSDKNNYADWIHLSNKQLQELTLKISPLAHLTIHVEDRRLFFNLMTQLVEFGHLAPFIEIFAKLDEASKRQTIDYINNSNFKLHPFYEISLEELRKMEEIGIESWHIEQMANNLSINLANANRESELSELIKQQKLTTEITTSKLNYINWDEMNISIKALMPFWHLNRTKVTPLLAHYALQSNGVDGYLDCVEEIKGDHDKSKMLLQLIQKAVENDIPRERAREILSSLNTRGMAEMISYFPAFDEFKAHFEISEA
jgi:hypothetical protein